MLSWSMFLKTGGARAVFGMDVLSGMFPASDRDRICMGIPSGGIRQQTFTHPFTSEKAERIAALVRLARRFPHRGDASAQGTCDRNWLVSVSRLYGCPELETDRFTS